jgi:hypothetical protein
MSLHDSIFALHPWLTPAQRVYLKGLSFEQASAAVRQLVDASTAPRGAVRASRSQQANEIAERFGRAVKEPSIHWEGNELVLERISPTAARELLAARGYQAPATRADMAEVRAAIFASAASANGRALR